MPVSFFPQQPCGPMTVGLTRELRRCVYKELGMRAGDVLVLTSVAGRRLEAAEPGASNADAKHDKQRELPLHHHPTCHVHAEPVHLEALVCPSRGRRTSCGDGNRGSHFRKNNVGTWGEP